MKRLYGIYNGREVYAHALTGGDLTAEVLDLGGIVHALRYRGVDVCLGFRTVEDYLASGSYAGAAVGRVANRIAGGRFTLDGRTCDIVRNDGENTNHGGAEGFDRRVFDAEERADGTLALTMVSPDGDQGFPGRLTFTAEYSVRGDELTVRYSAVSDRDTLWAPTCHLYFALSGESAPTLDDTMLRINAQTYAPIRGHLPTGEVRSVEGTPFDFREYRCIATAIAEGGDALAATGGYDHNFFPSGTPSASAYCKSTGIKLEISSDLPGLQLYTSGGLARVRGKTATYGPRTAFCLEPQFVPNAVNLSGFDVPVLKAGKKRVHTIVYRFSTI